MEERAFSTLPKCIAHIKSNEFGEAVSETQTFIEKCKNIIITERDAHYLEYSDEALLLGIIFRGIQNFANLKQMTLSPDWIKYPESIEQVWVEMWDCKDRLEYAHPVVKAFGLEWIFDDINSLYTIFNRTFGHGLYASLGFMVEKMTCSICGQDIRAREHLPGRIYSGKVCGGVPSGITTDHALLTEHPKDPRGRVWFWNEIKEHAYSADILHFFGLDDFMREISP